jgi:hypothetical protein
MGFWVNGFWVTNYRLAALRSFGISGQKAVNQAQNLN